MKKLISMALAAGMAVSLAACGGAASSSAPAADSAAASTTEAAADSDLAYIQGKGKMTIGYTVYEPMNYTDADGNFTGFDTELATAVCEKLGVEPDFVEINWDTKIVELDAKSIDCIWNGMTLTDEIQANAACTKAYAKNAQVVVMKSDADYSSTADLVGKTVVACTNLKPRKMMGIMSNGMLISAVKEEPDGSEKLHLLMRDDQVPAGYGLC